MILHTILSFLAPMVWFIPGSGTKDKPNVTADPWSIDGFIAWAESNPTDKHYQWANGNICLLAQWGQHLNPKEHQVYGYTTALNTISAWGCAIKFERAVAVYSPHTFGAAVERAKIYKAKHGL